MRGGRRERTFDWTDARVERLKRMIADGLSARQAAAEFGISRNAAIGKALRIGCPFCSNNGQSARTPAGRKASVPAPARPRAKRPAPAPVVKPASPGKSSGVACVAAPLPEPDLSPASPDPETAVRFADADAGRCQWPLGDPSLGPDMPVCGGRSARAAGRASPLGRSFCAYHLKLAVRP